MAAAVDTKFARYQRARNWVVTLERFRVGEAIMDATGYMAAEMAMAFREEWWKNPLHRATFRAIKELIGRGARDLDVGMVIGEMQRLGTFEQFANAAACVCSLTEGAVPPPTRASRLFRLEEMRRAWRELDLAREEAQR